MRDLSNSEKIEFLESIIALMPCHVYWLDRGNVIQGCNDLQAKALGLLSREEIVGKTNQDFIKSEEHAKAHDAINKQVMESGEPHYLEEETEDEHGKKQYFWSQKVPMPDNSGKIIGLLGISIDITDRKRAEELEKEHLKSEERIKSTQAIAMNIAHELRTPLTSISAAMQGLKKYLPKLLHGYQLAVENKLCEPTISRKHLEILDQITDNIERETRASHTIIDMLMVKSRLELKKPEQLVKLSMAESISNALQRYPFKSDKEARIVVANSSTDFEYLGIELFTTHILFNLVQNALYFLRAKPFKENEGESITIKLETGSKYNKLIFRDNGVGINKESLPHVFEPLFTNKLNGTGSGLAFCKMVMDTYHGKIECYSEEGSYTEFVLRFPAV